MGDFTARFMSGRIFQDESDRRQGDGAPGVVFNVKHTPSGKSTGVTVHCAEDHEHSRDCALAALKAPTVGTGEMRLATNPDKTPKMVDEDRGPQLDAEGFETGERILVRVQAVEEVKVSPLERAKRNLLAQVADAAVKAAAPVRVKALPTVEKVKDGKRIRVPDTAVADGELA